MTPKVTTQDLATSPKPRYFLPCTTTTRASSPVSISRLSVNTSSKKFRQLFVTHQKAPERTWIDFNPELNTYFNEWIDGLKIDTFNKLSDLIITDQLKRKTPFEFKEYYLDEWANMNSPVQLEEKLEEFEDFKRTLKKNLAVHL
ncbi:uncharacterized protein TNCV_3705131 [Trichonephila clavipes]|nr:uncharacterized protein TNCV_3705131 [Trichonephila clavipes]